MPRIVREATVAWEGSLSRGSGVATARDGQRSSCRSTCPSRISDKPGEDEPGGAARRGARHCYVTSLAGEIARAGGTVERLDLTCTVTMDEVGEKGHLIVASEIEARARAEGIDQAGLEQAAQAPTRAAVLDSDPGERFR